MDSTALLSALGLLLVFEGIVPFLNPRSARRLYLLASQMPDQQLRIVGLVAMLVGVVILSVIRS